MIYWWSLACTEIWPSVQHFVLPTVTDTKWCKQGLLLHRYPDNKFHSFFFNRCSFVLSVTSEHLLFMYWTIVWYIEECMFSFWEMNSEEEILIATIVNRMKRELKYSHTRSCSRYISLYKIEIEPKKAIFLPPCSTFKSSFEISFYSWLF